ncbi:hypothetical protein V5799_003825 [Amblyomma americanum]|uniref:O-acyltransferase WSD1 C-terminal domain-containing protein n=1 Tax=Amblyomma americanum TaxID=6943 RepID=A0AAQ4D7V3_AMBAM
MDELKNSPDPVVLYGAANILFTLLPCRLAHWFMGMWHRKPSAVFCNLPGPEEPVVLGLSRVKTAVAWAGWTPEVPLAVTITSYAGAFNVAVSSQMDIVPDPDEILKEFANQLDHLSDLLSKRRIPGEHRRRSSYTAERRNQEIARPPLHELQQKLQSVQDELHRVRHALDELRLRQLATPTDGDLVAVVTPFGEPPDSPEPELLIGEQERTYSPVAATQGEDERERLEARLGELQEEFSELLIGLRRRKSAADNVLLDTDVEEDDDLDGELRRPTRRRALSVTVRRASLQAVVSTTRPLTTGSSHHQGRLTLAAPHGPQRDRRTLPTADLREPRARCTGTPVPPRGAPVPPTAGRDVGAVPPPRGRDDALPPAEVDSDAIRSRRRR